MQQMIEFFQMVSANDQVLDRSEKLAILKARLALNAFERAMESFRCVTLDAPAAAEKVFPIAA